MECISRDRKVLPSIIHLQLIVNATFMEKEII